MGEDEVEDEESKGNLCPMQISQVRYKNYGYSILVNSKNANSAEHITRSERCS